MEFYWLWLIAGLCLIALEMLAPVAYFLWFGVSSLMLGLLTYFYTSLSIFSQALLFCAFSIIVTILGRRFIPIHIEDKHDKYINKKVLSIIGKEYTLNESIKDGRAQIKIGETLWNIKGPDLEKGVKIKIIDIENNCLIVDKSE